MELCPHTCHSSDESLDGCFMCKDNHDDFKEFNKLMSKQIKKLEKMRGTQ